MVAQTNIQLYNQLRERGMPLEDLLLVRRAYELNTTLYTGYFQADGKSFTAHGVGVASVLAEIGQPAHIIAFGLVHNVYGNGNFGDGRGPGPCRKRRQLVRDAVGERVEAMAARFGDRRLGHKNVDDMLAELGEMDEFQRTLILVDVADRIEKHADLGVLYYGENDWITGDTDRAATELIELASALDPRLGTMLSESFARVAAEAGKVPAELRPADGRRYAKLEVPLSCRRRFAVWQVPHHVRGRLKLRRRYRALRAALAS